MKQFVIDHIWHISSFFSYSLLEYYIGKTKKIEANSLLEIILNNLKEKLK